MFTSPKIQDGGIETAGEFDCGACGETVYVEFESYRVGSFDVVGDWVCPLCGYTNQNVDDTSLDYED